MPYIIGGVAAVVIIFIVASSLLSSDDPPEVPRPATNKRPPPDNRRIAGGYPSKAEDVYRDARKLLDRAMSPSAGIDQDKLKAAIKKLDEAVAGYRKLKEEHPGERRIEVRIETINRLLYRAKKSVAF
jgi:hypothetical protein